MENEKAKQLAERIALLLVDGGKETDDFSVLRASLEKINERLDKIESGLNPSAAVGHSPVPHRLSNLNHPSLERFAVEEAITDEINQYFGTEKACTFEPNGKPCDHCAMCNSRGF